jgi:hypothetical protein
MDNLPPNPLSSFFILKKVKQETLHFIVKEVNYKSMALEITILDLTWVSFRKLRFFGLRG